VIRQTAGQFPAPDSDPFYAPIGAIGRPGDVRRIREIDLGSEVNSWQVRYLSSNSLGRSIVPSGTVIVPRKPYPGQRPIVCYGTSVHGLDPNCAPSYQIRQGTELEIPLINKVLQHGWAVAIADGEGLGAGGPHTLLAGRAAGHTLLDIARAAQLLPDAALSDAPVSIWGYSGGGRAAAWAAELQPSYAPELELCVVVAGGVPADPNVLMRATMTGPFQGLGFAALVGLSTAYHHLPLRDILNETGRSAAKRAEHEDLPGLLANYAQPITAYSNCPEPWNSPHWKQVLQAERTGKHCPAAPVHLYHATDDVLCPISMGRRLAEDYRALGASVTWTELPTDHLRGIVKGAGLALDTLAHHFSSATQDSGAA
jgi:pimeloyl-ACP methyl ester carboxylesterase